MPSKQHFLGEYVTPRYSLTTQYFSTKKTHLLRSTHGIDSQLVGPGLAGSQNRLSHRENTKADWPSWKNREQNASLIRGMRNIGSAWQCVESRSLSRSFASLWSPWTASTVLKKLKNVSSERNAERQITEELDRATG